MEFPFKNLLLAFGLSIILSTTSNAGQKINGYLEVLPASQYPSGNPSFEVTDFGQVFSTNNIQDFNGEGTFGDPTNLGIADLVVDDSLTHT